MSSFNSSIMISEDLNRRLALAAQDLAFRAINECASIYGFNGEEAIARLGLSSVVVRREVSRKSASSKKVVVEKPAFPLPYNGEYNAECCEALRQNNGLYTQCQVAKKGTEMYCKSCQQLVAKSADGIPEYGTIDQRQAVGPFEYVDPKGRRPVAYTKVMRKYKVSEEQVLAEAGKFNINILAEHFASQASESKRGRPKKEGLVAKEPKGAKGRPKKTKKVLEIEGDDEEDLFVSMVAAASSPAVVAMSSSASNSDNESIGAQKITKKVSSEEKAAQKAAKEAKALKKQQDEEAKALKKQLEEEAKAAKALKKQEEEAARAVKKQQEEEAKAAKALKKQQEEEAKAAKALKKQEEEEAKAAKSAPKAAKEEPKPEQQDSVKKFEWEGKKYLRSKLSGVIYDREVYDASGEIVQIGRWNEAQQRIDFLKQEESEEEESSDSESEEEAEEYEN
jgi:hypothetical protein